MIEPFDLDEFWPNEYAYECEKGDFVASELAEIKAKINELIARQEAREIDDDKTTIDQIPYEM